MFTGIVEEVGRIAAVDGPRLVVTAEITLEGLCISDSILVSGACLTVVQTSPASFTVEVIPETAARTTLAGLRPGDGVNLERALRYDGRIGGHLVQGHVDGVAEVASLTPDGNSVRIGLKAPPSIMRYVVEKGFIALDGVSLTVAGVSGHQFSVAVIPYTREHTTISERGLGELVNIEVDVVAKYVEQLVRPYSPALVAPEGKWDQTR